MIRNGPVALACVLMSFVYGALARAQAPVDHRVEAKVNDKIITEYDVYKQAEGRLARLKQRGRSNLVQSRNALRRLARMELIEEKLQEIEGSRLAESNPLVKDHLERAVREEIEKRRLEFGGENNLRDFVELNMKLTYREFKQKLYDYMLREMVQQRFISDKLNVTPAEMQEFYRKNILFYQAPAEVNYSQIYLPYDGAEQKEEQLALAARLAERARKGESFAVLAKNDSASSLAGTTPSDKLIPLDHLAPTLQKALRNLEPGQVSEPVETDGAIRVFRMNRKKPAKTIPFQDVQDAIETQLKKQKRDREYERLLNRLWQENYVWIRGQGRVLERPRL